jgi:hypothetical protein
VQDEIQTDVEVRAISVGHRVPTGFVDRQVLLVVEGLSADGQPTDMKAGPRLDQKSGQLAGLPGKLFAKQIKDTRGARPAPFWRGDADVLDTRLVPEQPDLTVFKFGREMQRLRVRLIYRRFWAEVAEAKGWPNDDIVVLDEMITVDPDKLTYWPGR